MSGKTKGASAQFCLRTENEKAVCFHCGSHEPNLCLSKTSKVPQISTMQFLGLFYKFSPKRQRKAELLISLKNSCKDGLKSKVKAICETRWVERHATFEDL